MTVKSKYRLISLFIASVWLINGLFCKVLGLVPRHEQIVAAILGADHASILTILIGLAEIGMAIWILTGYKYKLNAVIQISVVAIMNVLEYILVPELLLWGRFNAVFALLFICLVYHHAFVMKTQIN